MMKKKIDTVTMIGFAGMILGGIANMIGNWSQQQNMEKMIAEKVEEALEERLGGKH